MSTFIYSRPTDRFDGATTALGTFRVSVGTEDPAYPVKNLVDGRPDHPAKLLDRTGAAWVCDLAIAQHMGLVGIINHNFDPGLKVYLSGNATDVWSSPSYSYPFVVPERRLDRFTSNLWVVVNKTFRYWRLTVVGQANSAPLSVGEWAMYHTARDLGVRNIKWGSTRHWNKPSIVHETEMGVRRAYTIGTVYRSLEVGIQPTDTGVRDVDDWFRSADGNVRPFLVVPSITDGEAECWMVTFTDADLPYTREVRNYNTATLSFRELSPGLYP
jgi:hypothetical protein